MSDERPNLAPLSPRMSGRGLPLPPRLLVVSVITALVAFGVGLQVNPTRVVTLPAPSAVPPSSALRSTPLATPAPTDTPVVPPTPLPVGLYHVTQRMANEIAIAARFYAAYNAGQLAVEMSLLSPTPQLVDCDYMTHALVIVAGRSAIAIYLRARFAEHDHWIVEFYNENPANDGLVLALPLQRSNDTLRRLGAAGGVKSSFPVDSHFAFSPDGLHIESIGWDTMPGDATALCSP
jgi:hypothetical protein